MAAAESLRVEVIYALPGHQRRVAVRVRAGASVADAIRQSGIAAQFPEVDPQRSKVGIFSRRVSPQAIVRDGDRIEIYRPLIADPKAVRRERAKNRSG